MMLKFSSKVGLRVNPLTNTVKPVSVKQPPVIRAVVYIYTTIWRSIFVLHNYIFKHCTFKGDFFGNNINNISSCITSLMKMPNMGNSFVNFRHSL